MKRVFVVGFIAIVTLTGTSFVSAQASTSAVTDVTAENSNSGAYKPLGALVKGAYYWSEQSERDAEEGARDLGP